MKQRPSGFLSAENIDHDSEIFDYIRELHDYLWRYVKLYDPSASGKLSEYIDPVLDRGENISKQMKDVIYDYSEGEMYLNDWTLMDVRRCMTEYAKLMCDEQRQICLDDAIVSLNYDWVTENPNPDVRRSTILNAPYPEELR